MNQPTPDQVLRLNILQLANSYNGDVNEKVECAKAYYAFVIGPVVEKSGEPKLGVEEVAVDPGVKRGKGQPKKEEPVETIASPELEEVQEIDETAVTVDYKQVQTAVLDLVRGKPNGKELAVGVLNHFNVATALDLKPEQYAEALVMFQEAIANG